MSDLVRTGDRFKPEPERNATMATTERRNVWPTTCGCGHERGTHVHSMASDGATGCIVCPCGQYDPTVVRVAEVTR